MIESLSDILIVTDIDGTLLWEKQGISKENLAAIKRFVGKGGHFTISTGRAIDSTKEILSKVPINAPSIHINGGYFYDWKTEKILYPNYVSTNAKSYCKAIVERFPFCDCHFVNEKSVNLMTSGEVLRKYIPSREFNFFSGSFEAIPDNAYKFIVCCDMEHMDEIREYAKSVCKDDVLLIQSSEFFLEVLPAQNSKGRALEKLCEMLNIPAENSVGVGDFENDIEMLRAAGIGAAVDNAQEKVKEAADVVLPACEENAIAHLISFLEEMYE